MVVAAVEADNNGSKIQGDGRGRCPKWYRRQRLSMLPAEVDGIVVTVVAELLVADINDGVEVRSRCWWRRRRSMSKMAAYKATECNDGFRGGHLRWRWQVQ